MPTRRFTIEYEIRHFVGGAIMLAISLASVVIWKKGDLFVLVVANILINGYPLMLQRYNRIRIDNVLKRILDN